MPVTAHKFATPPDPAGRIIAAADVLGLRVVVWCPRDLRDCGREAIRSNANSAELVEVTAQSGILYFINAERETSVARSAREIGDLRQQIAELNRWLHENLVAMKPSGS